ncbi:response regulator transcription factor [Brevundimonas variabilis]|uniref:Two-component system response regulator QseB n=1 Tax=Brevundimonas variabilis TaxID=74312 RepID=A0A7W9FD97_9CAUL|nr:response regulator transcription factor [Brevundimonas variabilis]MBB5745196.1 two-component system response regulator QseB [Brevundimonas variabilis]
MRLGALLSEGLIRDGFVVDWRQNLRDAEEAVGSATYDLILLDLGLPDGDGLDWVKTLRRSSVSTPILVLTARGGLNDRVTGLDAGADDYLVKPFEASELAARCRAILRRPGQRITPVLTVGELAFDVASRQASCRDTQIELSRRESDLLELLMRRAGTVVTRAALEESLYAFNEPVTPNAVEAAVSRLRRKLDDAGCDGMLHTVRGLGYLMKDVTR